MGTVEEFSGICTFLCSKQAAFVNGQSITVDGGTAPGLLWFLKWQSVTYDINLNYVWFNSLP